MYVVGQGITEKERVHHRTLSCMSETIGICRAKLDYPLSSDVISDIDPLPIEEPNFHNVKYFMSMSVYTAEVMLE